MKRKTVPRHQARKRKQRPDPWRWIPTLLALVRFGLWLYEKNCK